MPFRNREELIAHIESGKRMKFLFFWGHQKAKSGVLKGCFSQWYSAGFESDSIYYRTAEHYMMAKKAGLFGDHQTVEKILAASHPGEAQRRGREVARFDETVWADRRFDIVVAANRLKFSQNPELRTFLLNTGRRVLVEASPVDTIWGIGLVAEDPAAENPRLWKGLNLLGFALMQVRAKLSN